MTKMGYRILSLTLLVWLNFTTFAYAADWKDMIDFSGSIESDMRYIVEDYRGLESGDGFKFQTNRNDVKLRLDFYPNDNVRAVIETKVRFFGFNESANLPELADREKLDPFNIQLDEAYIAVTGFLWENIDFRIGRLIVNWGAADQFNPTDNVNGRDFSDQLDYAAKVPNQMIEVSMYPVEWFSFTVVWVPIFKPSQLPASASLGFAVEYEANGCFKTAPTPPIANKADAQELADMFGAIDPCALYFSNTDVKTISPALTLANSQVAVRTQFHVADFEFSFSYYYGRFSFPIALDAIAIVEESTEFKDTLDVAYIADLIYPRMQVIGFDFTYSAEWLFDMGFFGEAALILPEEITFALKAIQDGNTVVNISSPNVSSDPFIKATAGMDYTFTSWLYMNAMYIRGFFDEFGDLYGIHNYVSLAADLKFFDDALAIRLAGVLNCDDLSAVVTPTITWIVYPSVELISGGLFFIGNTVADDPLDYASKSKFGQKATGRNIVYVKARFSW